MIAITPVVRLFGGLTLVLAVCLVVVLSRQVRAERAELATARERLRVVAVGDVVPPLHAMALDGARLDVADDPSQALHVVFVFNTSCPFCLQTLPTWQDLAARLGAMPGVAAVGWSHDPDSLTLQYVAEHALRFPVIAPGPRWRMAYKVGRVPTTLVVSAAGRVLYARAGVLSDGAVDSLLTVVAGSAVDSVLAVVRRDEPAHGIP